VARAAVRRRVRQSHTLNAVRIWRKFTPLEGSNFADGRRIENASAGKIPPNMMDRLLDDGDLRELQGMPLKKKPAAPSVRHRTTVKRSVGKS